MRSVLWSALLAAVLAPSAWAGPWSLGSNLGVTFFNPDEGDQTTVFAIPGASGGLQPGLRLGLQSESGRHEYYADTGLLLTSGEGVSQDAFEITANYQFNFSAGRLATSPYVTAGIGLLQRSIEFELLGENFDFSGMSAIFGAGVGVRAPLGGENASLRAELRLDFVTEGEDDGFVVQPEGTAIGIKLGFDVWP